MCFACVFAGRDVPSQCGFRTKLRSARCDCGNFALRTALRPYNYSSQRTPHFPQNFRKVRSFSQSHLALFNLHRTSHFADFAVYLPTISVNFCLLTKIFLLELSASVFEKSLRIEWSDERGREGSDFLDGRMCAGTTPTERHEKTTKTHRKPTDQQRKRT